MMYWGKKLMNQLYLKHNYLNKSIAYLKNNVIREYDMVNAGINILRYNNVLSQEDYDKLNSMEKLEKNVLVGKFLRDNPDINEALTNEFINVRKMLFEANDINDDDILSIKKDAFFIINKKMPNLQLNEFYQFKEKNRYIGYMNLDGKEFYHKGNKRSLDIKGFSKVVKEHHVNFLFKDLEELMFLDMKDEKNLVFERLIQLKYNFVKRQLDNGYYLDVSQGKYLFESAGLIFSLHDMDDELKENCFIQNNLAFILRMINVLV
jgi:hypothetical protein